MKREYSKPAMEVEVFEASEYVAACWKINCNVPNGYGYKDANGNNTYDKGIDKLLTPSDRRGNPSTVWGCGTWHTGVKGVPDDGPQANAMWHPNRGGNDYAVYYWRDGNGALDVHFSKVSDAKWETNPNAS